MQAKELYSVLDRELGPTLQKLGFKKKRASRLVYQRATAKEFQTVWFQTDKYGWDQYAGGKFYVNFSTSPDAADYETTRSDRLNVFLTEGELQKAREFRDEIVGRIPRPPESYFTTLEAGFQKTMKSDVAARLIDTVRKEFEPESLPYRSNQDFSLRYWTADDVAGWARFIAPVIPRATSGDLRER